MIRCIPPSKWLLSGHHHSEIGSPRARYMELFFPLAPWEPKQAVEEEADLSLYLCESIKMKGTEQPWQIPTCISTVDVQSKCLCIYPHNEVGLDLLRNKSVIFGKMTLHAPVYPNQNMLELNEAKKQATVTWIQQLHLQKKKKKNFQYWSVARINKEMFYEVVTRHKKKKSSKLWSQIKLENNGKAFRYF